MNAIKRDANIDRLEVQIHCFNSQLNQFFCKNIYYHYLYIAFIRGIFEV